MRGSYTPSESESIRIEISLRPCGTSSRRAWLVRSKKIHNTFLELTQSATTNRWWHVRCSIITSMTISVETLTKSLWQQLRADLCGAEGQFAPEGDRIGKQLIAFKQGIELVCDL